MASQERPEIAPDEEEFYALVVRHFDAAYYLQMYQDVAQAGLDLPAHWLNQGFAEDRQISRSVVVRRGRIARKSSDRIWRHYRWRGEDIAVKLIAPVPTDVISQIVNQGRHDPVVQAEGPDSIATLIPADRENVHIDVVGLQRAIPHGMEFLLIVPTLSMSQERSIATDLVTSLIATGVRSIQTIVADHEFSESPDERPVPGPFQMTKVLFWRDFWVEGPEAVKLWQLAQLIRVLKPRVMIVADSRHGHEIVARFGRVLSERTKIFCIYTAADQGGGFAARLPRRTLPFATALTDDAVVAGKLREQYDDVLGHGVVVVPHDSPAALVDAVAALFVRT